MNYLKRKYYEYQIDKLQDEIDLIKGLLGRTEKELVDNISYIRCKAKLDCYKILLSVVAY